MIIKENLESITLELIDGCLERGWFIDIKKRAILGVPFTQSRSKIPPESKRLIRDVCDLISAGNLYPGKVFKVFGLAEAYSFKNWFKYVGIPYPDINTLYPGEIREMARKTCIEKYGVPHSNQCEDIKEKARKTNLKRYGHENPFGSPKIKEKIKQTNLGKYGYESALSSPEIKEKIEQTNIERYGVSNPLKSKKIRAKVQETMVDRYGGKVPMRVPELKEKIRQTNLERFGVEWAAQNEDVKQKASQISISKYGVDNAMKAPKVYEKFLAAIRSPEARVRMIEGRRRNDPRFNEKMKIFGMIKMGTIPVEAVTNLKYTYSRELQILKELGLKEPTEFSTELKIKALLESLGINFIQNAKKAHGVRKSKLYYDADFLIPDMKLVIEVNGLAYHSVNRSAYGNRKTKDYHFNKFKSFYDAGYRMLSFTDYELKHMWHSVTEIIQFHLGLLETLSESTLVEYREFLGYPIEESLNYNFFNKSYLNFENFRSPENFIVPRMLDGWEYWDCGRIPEPVDFPLRIG